MKPCPHCGLPTLECAIEMVREMCSEFALEDRSYVAALHHVLDRLEANRQFHRVRKEQTP